MIIVSAVLAGINSAKAAETVSENPTPANEIVKVRESIFSSSPTSGSLATSHFTWGADIGAAIDLRGFDMSTFDIDLNIGYKSKVLRTLGVGVGMHRSFSNGSTFIPVYVLLRTSFTEHPSLFFFNFKAGYSFNTLADTPTKGGTNISLGLGINLAMSKKFQSHIILSYGYFQLSQAQQTAILATQDHVDEVQIRFGVNF